MSISQLKFFKYKYTLNNEKDVAIPKEEMNFGICNYSL